MARVEISWPLFDLSASYYRGPACRLLRLLRRGRLRVLRVLRVLLLIGSVRKHALSGTSWAWGASRVASPVLLRHEGLDGVLVPAAQRFQLEWGAVGGKGSDEGRMGMESFLR